MHSQAIIPVTRSDFFDLGSLWLCFVEDNSIEHFSQFGFDSEDIYTQERGKEKRKKKEYGRGELC
jgi:hypothetical protein